MGSPHTITLPIVFHQELISPHDMLGKGAANGRVASLLEPRIESGDKAGMRIRSALHVGADA